VRISVEPRASDDDKRVVRERVDLYNIARTGFDECHEVSIFLRGDLGEIRGGLLGLVWGGWLHVQHLWVEEALRGGGHGRALLEAAEAFARERGCTDAHVESHSFQAPEFYEKLGYQRFGEIAKPSGHGEVFLRKRLA